MREDSLCGGLLLATCVREYTLKTRLLRCDYMNGKCYCSRRATIKQLSSIGMVH